MESEPYPLTHAYWKTERAKIHLDELKTAIAAFEEHNPYKITPNEEPERDAIRYKIEVQQPHVTMFLIAADVFQCLRTALDQAIWSLARMNHQNPGRTQFPVFQNPPTSSRAIKTWNRQIFGVPPKAVEFIESLQPYNRPSGTPITTNNLWLLHEMNRIEKHCSIWVRRMGTLVSRIRVGVGVPHPDFARSSFEETDYGYDVVYFGRYKDLQPKLTPMIVFGEEESGIHLSIWEIDGIYKFVADYVLPRLAGFAQK